jgi:hypothetical protein
MNTKKKKSKIELAREIIANLRLGMNRPPLNPTNREIRIEATPFAPQPRMSTRRTNQLQTSHS